MYQAISIYKCKKTGFNYQFNALNVDEKPDELNAAFSTIFNMDSNITIGMILQEVIPFLRNLVRTDDPLSLRYSRSNSPANEKE